MWTDKYYLPILHLFKNFVVYNAQETVSDVWKNNYSLCPYPLTNWKWQQWKKKLMQEITSSESVNLEKATVISNFSFELLSVTCGTLETYKSVDH
jgi:hypothetical protein